MTESNEIESNTMKSGDLYKFDDIRHVGLYFLKNDKQGDILIEHVTENIILAVDRFATGFSGCLLYLYTVVFEFKGTGIKEEYYKFLWGTETCYIYADMFAYALKHGLLSRVVHNISTSLNFEEK